MKKPIKVQMDSSIESKLKRFAFDVAKRAAQQTANDVTNEYIYSLEQFYNSYTPRYYKRTDELRNKSYSKYLKNSGRNSYWGGVLISSEKMNDDLYNGSAETVLNTALRGFHGSPSLGLFTSPAPLRHVIDFRNSLITNIDEWFSPSLTSMINNFRL